MKEYLTLSNVKDILQNIDGECVPLVFIDHVDIFYNSGEVKTIDGTKIRSLFPTVKNTTMGILNNNKDISEINVKVDMQKIHTYLNDICRESMSIIHAQTQRNLDNNTGQ